MERYTEFHGGYLDAYTGLIWKLHPEDGLFTYEQAKQLETPEWRLPTVHELFGIVDTNRFDPATLLPNHTSDAYWTSSYLASRSDFAWGVNFGSGFANYFNRIYGRNVRLVRR